MNRSVTLAGGLLLVVGIVGIGLALELGPSGFADATLLFGTTSTPLGLLLTLYGATRPDPEMTTVRGRFGSEEENLLVRRLREQQRRTVDPRYLPSPRESVNCGRCYTVIPAQSVLCPRCGEHRRCQACGKRLYLLAGAVRCGPCTKDEVYCDCPRAAPSGGWAPGRPSIPG